MIPDQEQALADLREIQRTLMHFKHGASAVIDTNGGMDYQSHRLEPAQ